MNSYCIYRHTSPSGKVYIGQTYKTPEERWRNGKGYKNSTLLENTIKKYGWNNIKHEILFTNLNKISADCIEIDLIFYYKKLGISLNITDGGEGVRGREVSEETKRKMSESKIGKYKGINNPNYGKKASLEARMKMSKAKIGRKLSEETKKKVSLNHSRWNKGLKTSEEVRKKLSESHKGIKQSEETKLKRSKAMLEKGGKPVLLYDESGKIIKEFNSASECERYIGLKRGAVSSSIANNRKTIKKIYKVCYKYD